MAARHLFYNDSAFDDASDGLTDDDAIATDPALAGDPEQVKSALLPGGPVSFKNYSNFSRGINGLMIDAERQ